jgi:hypothetical protein
MGTGLSLAIMCFVIWGIRRITVPRLFQCLTGLALIVFYFKYVISWIVALEEVRDSYFLDYETLLFGIFYLGVDLVIYSWWRDDESK